MANIYSTSANETLTGTAGNDSYIFTSNNFGKDTIVDAGGNDTIDMRAITLALTVNLGSGNKRDEIYIDANNSVNWSGSTIDNFLSGSGNDDITGNGNDNYLFGGAGNDIIAAKGGDDILEGGDGDDTLDGGAGNDTYIFKINWGVDTLADSGGSDTLDFSTITQGLIIDFKTSGMVLGANSVTWGSATLENIIGGSGNDILTGNSAANSLYGNDGNDTLIGNGGSDKLYGGNGNDSLDGGAGNDTLDGGDGDDFYYFANTWGDDTLIDSSGNDTVDFSAVTSGVTINLNGTGASQGGNTIVWTANTIENAIGGSANDIITGTNGNNMLTGNAGNDTLNGLDGDDVLDGGAGNDTLNGGNGNDTYLFANNWGVDILSDTGGVDTVNFSTVTTDIVVDLAGTRATSGTNSVTWTAGVIENVATGSGNDTITGSSADNAMNGGAGNDTYIFANNWGVDTIIDSAGNDTLNFSAVTTDVIVNLSTSAASSGSSTVSWNANAIENAIGGSGNDTLTSNSANNTLNGGAGNDTYVFLNGWGVDVITDASGNDTITFSSVTTDLNINLSSNSATSGANSVTWASNAIENAIGGSGNDLITSSSANNNLNGGAGNDTYLFLNGWGVDTIIDASGTDTVNFSNVTTDVVINLGGTGASSGAHTVTWVSGTLENAVGGSGNDIITGSSANNILNGGAGNDTYIFIGSWGADIITDSSGTDTVDFSAVTAGITANLAGTGASAGSNTVTWVANAIENITTGSGNDTITGSSANNILNGGAGNDTYIFANNWGVDTIIDASGTDTISFSGVTSNLVIDLNATSVTSGANSVSWAGSVIENATGGSGNDTITGNSANNVLSGGAGNDTYVFADGWGADTILDSSGIDTVDLSSLTTDLLVDLSGTGASSGSNTISWAANIIENVIAGSGNDRLISSSANNILNGGAGDDVYVFKNGWGNDTIIDIMGDAGGKKDTVDFSAVTSNLIIHLDTGLGGHEVTDGVNTVNWSGNYIEIAIGGSGNDMIYGNADKNQLNGGRGNDLLDGGDGDDKYLFDDDWGTDVIYDSSGDYDGVHFEGVTRNLTINLATWQATDGTNRVTWTGDIIDEAIGGSGNDTIYGNAGKNVLDGWLGNDLLDGGDGDDNYNFKYDDWGQDTIVDSSGIDQINFDYVTRNLIINLNSGAGPEVSDGVNTVNWSGNVIENAKGGLGNDTIYGNADANQLFGLGGNDTLYGGAGNDGLYGGDGDDILDGGDGNDYYYFGANWGNDTIVADASGTWDTLYFIGITANLTVNLTAGAGYEVTDGFNTIQILGDFIESVSAGSGNDTLTGNASNNTLWGLAGNDILRGLAGNDTLDGGAGNDTLDGGDGNDTYVFADGWGADTILDSSGTDTIDLTQVTAALVINLNASALHEVHDGTNTINWTGNIIENVKGGSGNDTITGNSLANSLSGGLGNDTIYGGGGNDILNGGEGNDMLDGGDGDDVYTYQTANWGIDTIIADASGTDLVDFKALSQNLTINLTAGAGYEITDGTNHVDILGNFIENARGGMGNDVITGNALNNALWGQEGNDTLYGLAGNDSLYGGDGDDLLDGGDGNDSYYFLGNWGHDTIIADASGTYDTIYFTDATANLTINLTVGAGYEVTDGSNTVQILGDFIENAWAGSGNDTLLGNANNNTLWGKAGNDILKGFAGNDTLDGGDGNDDLDGGDGNDTYVFTGNWGNDTISADSSGTDTLDFSAITSNLTIKLTAGVGPEVTDGVNTVNIAGDFIENVKGGSGNDVIIGNALANSLVGGAGNDTLDGGDGNDILNGGTGDDLLIGGLGNDTYMGYSAGFGADVIRDVGGSGDFLDLRSFNLSAVLNWTALDLSGDTFVDALRMDFGGGNMITIENYFNNISIDDDLSQKGAGYIETIAFADDSSVDFNQVLTLVN